MRNFPVGSCISSVLPTGGAAGDVLEIQEVEPSLCISGGGWEVLQPAPLPAHVWTDGKDLTSSCFGLQALSLAPIMGTIMDTSPRER